MRSERPVRRIARPGINLAGTPPDPETFEGPLNVFIGLHGTGLAANQAEENKATYDENFPSTPVPPPEEPPPPLGEPISAGRPINPDMSKYVLDRSVAKRVLKQRR